MATLSSRGSLVVIFVIIAQCFLHAISASIPSDEQSRQTDVLPSNSSEPPLSKSDDSGLPVDLKGGFPPENFESRREGDLHHPPGDVLFGRKKKPHVLKSSPPVNRHPHPSVEPVFSPTPFIHMPSSPKPPCFHHVRIEPVEIPAPASISPLPFLSTSHQPYPRIEPAEIPASVQPVPHFYEPSHPPPSPKTEPTELPISVGSPSPSAAVDPPSSETIPNDFNIGDIFASTAAAEPHLSTSDGAVTPVQETLITQGPMVQGEEKPHADHKPAVEPKPHHSVIASIKHKAEHLKEKIHHKKEGENAAADAKPHHSIVESILHKKEHLVEKIHHKKDEEKNPAAAKPHHSIVSSLLHKKEHLKEKIHHEQKNEDHKENEVKEEKVPIAEKPNEGQHHEFPHLHKKVHVSAISSLLHKIHHKRDVKHHKAAVKPHGSAISSILHKTEHLKEKIHHKKTKENPSAATKPHRHSIVSSILHKKEHLKGAIHHEQEKEHSIIASIFHKKDEAKEVKVPAIESPVSEAHHHEPSALHKKPHESVVSSVLHKIHHKRESSSKHEEEESLNFDVPHIGLPVPKASILHKLKSGKDHEHKPHSLLKDILHKV